jgi:hypothetical protein
MKNTLTFIASFIVFGLLVFSCSAPSYAIQGVKYNGSCYVYYRNEPELYLMSSSTSMWVPCLQPDGVRYTDNTAICGPKVTYPAGKYWSYSDIKTYIWTGSAWSKVEDTNYGHEWETYQSLRDANPALLSVPLNTYPHSYWPTGPPDIENCSDITIDCQEKSGEVVELLQVDGNVSYDTPLCMEGCELEPNGVSAKIRRSDCNDDGTADDPCTLFVNYRYTGQECPQGSEESEDDPGCAYWQQVCEELCVGGDMDFSCTEGGAVNCGCLLPEYPIVQTPSGPKPDQDDDGLPTGDPSETDSDNDGDPDTTDPDPDGDGITSNDGDPDGDGEDNRGRFTFQNDPNWTDSHNGYGTDSDGDNDGDGQSNCTDDDIDGDGIPNDQDPDMDGDGVNNTSDVDADGCDGVDGTGEGEEGDNAGAADTDGDGDVDADDPPEEGEDWPTEEEIDQGYGDVTNNTYDGNVEGDFTDPDFDTTVQGYIDGNPFKTAIENSEINLTASDACFRFPNPYEGGTEIYCIDTYESYFNAMGLILLGLTGFICFRIIKG